MSNFTILYDAPQEVAWFRSLDNKLADANEVAINDAIKDARGWPSMQGVLAYDRPDIVLLDGETPILVIEETKEGSYRPQCRATICPDRGCCGGGCSVSVFLPLCSVEAWR